MKMRLLCLLFSSAQLTQFFLNGKVSITISTGAKARHFLFPLHVGGVIPGKLGASLHNSDKRKKDRNQFMMKEINTKNSHLLTLYLLVKKAMTGKARSWESVKTFWRKRFGWQLCCMENRQYQTSFDFFYVFTKNNKSFCGT